MLRLTGSLLAQSPTAAVAGPSQQKQQQQQQQQPSQPSSSSPTLTALALAALVQLFPDASPAFLTWAIGHHLSRTSSPSSSSAPRATRAADRAVVVVSVSVDEVVERVGDKVLDGLGELYPRRRPEELSSEEEEACRRAPSIEEDRVRGLNDDLLHLAQLYPSHPLSFLRALITDPTHAPAPLHLSSLALLAPVLPPSSLIGPTPPPYLLPHPATHAHLPKADRVRSTTYKRAVLAYLEHQHPTVGSARLRALGAEHNWDLEQTQAAVEGLVRSRGLAARLWGGLTSSLARLAPTPSSSSSSTSSSGRRKGKGRGGPPTPPNPAAPWEASVEFQCELHEAGHEARAQAAAADEAVARRVNQEEYSRLGEEVTCACCFGEEAWEEMGACAEGHLVCRDCINTHVSILSPSLTFPPEAVLETGRPPPPASSTLVPCPSCPTPPATAACEASIELPTLRRLLTAANGANYDKAVREALARALHAQHQRRAASPDVVDEVLGCPFCPFTALRPVGYPLAQPFTWSTTPSILTLPLALVALTLVTLATFHAPALPSFLPPLSAADGDEASVFNPRPTVRHAAAYVAHLVRRATHRLNGSTLRCRGAGCGRASCLSCGVEVWEGEGECPCLAGGSSAAGKAAAAAAQPAAHAGAGKPGVAGGSDEDTEKEELRLVVERAMTEAAVRTCPRCELGFMKSDSCNKMTCPRDGYKMCYVCRADVSTDGYAHFCPHFRLVPGPCTQCDLCDLYLLPDEDAVIRQAGADARRRWLKRKQAASLNGADRGWANGMRVGPLDDRGRRTRDLFRQIDAIATREVDRLVRLAGPATSSLDLLRARPAALAQLAGRNLSAVVGMPLLLLWSVVGTLGVVLAGGFA